MTKMPNRTDETSNEPPDMPRKSPFRQNVVEMVSAKGLRDAGRPMDGTRRRHSLLKLVLQGHEAVLRRSTGSSGKCQAARQRRLWSTSVS